MEENNGQGKPPKMPAGVTIVTVPRIVFWYILASSGAFYKSRYSQRCAHPNLPGTPLLAPSGSLDVFTDFCG